MSYSMTSSGTVTDMMTATGDVSLRSARGIAAVRQFVETDDQARALAQTFSSWHDLTTASALERVKRVGPWAATLRLPVACPSLPTDGRLFAVSCFEASYPPLLALAPGAPSVLWSASARPDVPGKVVALGGGSHASPAGVTLARQCAEALVDADFFVAALLSSSLGSAALDAARRRRPGRVIGIAPGGLSRPGPHEHEIAEVVRGGGRVVSGHRPDSAWDLEHLVHTEALLAGIADAVVVVEFNEHPGGGAQLVRSAHAYGRAMLVPELRLLDTYEAAADGVRVLALHRKKVSPAQSLPRAADVFTSTDDLVRGVIEQTRTPIV